MWKELSQHAYNAVETCRQKLLYVLALTVVYFIILFYCCVWRKIYTLVLSHNGMASVKLISGVNLY